MRSVQSVDLTLARSELERLWSPASLENLARTYWRFLSRVTAGLVRVLYGHDERSVVVLGRPLTLLRFDAPQYVLEADRGNVRWRIRDGLLVARAGRGCGYLAIDVRRGAPSAEPARLREPAGGARLHETEEPARLQIQIEVANFYPAIAARFSMPVYRATQSWIHVLVTYGFLRSLAELDLAPSKVGRFAERPPPRG